jgi:hypothetical protein
LRRAGYGGSVDLELPAASSGGEKRSPAADLERLVAGLAYMKAVRG